jgi:hypothetical protein
MPTVTIRVSAQEQFALRSEARARGVSVSELVRDALKLRGGDLEGRVEDVERRLSELERMAGI